MRIYGQPFFTSRLGASLCVLIVLVAVIPVAVLMSRFGSPPEHKSMTLVELQCVALAAAIGLLIGIERGWQERELHDGARVAGIRTFTLIGTLGGITGLIAVHWGGVALGFCFLAFALRFGLLEWWRASHADNYSVTDLVAGLLTFLLGSYAAFNMIVAAAADEVFGGWKLGAALCALAFLASTAGTLTYIFAR